MRLDLALIRAHPDLSRRKAQEVVHKGQVTVDGRTVLEPGHPVKEGAAVSWDPSRRALPRGRIDLPVLYRDRTLLVIDKPAGLLAVPTVAGAEDEDTALARVRAFARHIAPRRPYVGLVHRLDRDTSGALAFALDPSMRDALRALFRAHHVQRRYAALVRGEPREDAGEVDAPIQDAYVAGRRRVARADEPARPALTRWRVVERLGTAALLEVELGTGRQHQVRVHLAHIGHPVLGDRVYAREPGDAPRQMLHARVLGFRHPETGQQVLVESPLPEDFRSVLRRLRRAPRRRA